MNWREKKTLWTMATKIEPRLAKLLNDAKAVKDDGSAKSFCANAIWYRDFKPAVVRLAGWEAEQASLHTQEMYDAAYETVYDALPNCRNCSCF